MELIFDRKQLQISLKRLSYTISTAGIVPSGDHVLIEIYGDNAVMRTTDFTATSIVYTPYLHYDMWEPITLPVKRLLDFASIPNGDNIKLKRDKMTVVVSCGKSRMTIHGLVADEFSASPDFDSVDYFDLPLGDFIHNAQAILPTTDIKGTPAQTGLWMVARDGLLSLAGFSQFVLGEAQFTIDANIDFQLMIRSDMVASFIAAVPESNLVKIGADGKRVYLVVGGYKFAGQRVMFDQFPNWRGVYSSKFAQAPTCAIELNSGADFAAVMAQIILLYKPEAYAPVKIIASAGKLEFVFGNDMSENALQTQIDAGVTGSVEFAVGVALAKSIFTELKDNTLIQYFDSQSPLKITCENKTYVFMPHQKKG